MMVIKTSPEQKKSPPSSYSCALLALLAILAAGPVRGQTTWINASGGEWNTASNWDSGVPGDGIPAYLTNLFAAYTVNYDQPMPASAIGNLVLFDTTANRVTLNINANNFNAASIQVVTNGLISVAAGGVVNLTGGLELFTSTAALAITGGQWTQAGALGLGTGGRGRNLGALTIDGGNVRFEGTGNRIGSSEDGGRLLVRGGTVYLGGLSAVRNGNAFWTTGLVISNGVVTADTLSIGTGNSYATMSLSEGEVTVTNAFRFGAGTAASNRPLRYLQVGGVLRSLETMDGLVLVAAANQTANYTVQGGVSFVEKVTLGVPFLAGGSATMAVSGTGQIYIGSGGIVHNEPVTYAVNVGGGGTLGASAPFISTALIAANSGIGYLKAADQGGTPFDITLPGFQGSGTLAKIGAGKVSLQGTSTHTGNLEVQEGVLALEGGSIASTVGIIVGTGGVFDGGAGFTLNSGQNLAGTGKVKNNISAGTGASVRPGGNGAVGTLTFSNDLAQAGGVVNNFDLAAPAASDRVVVEGTLSLAGLNTIIASPQSGFTMGTYPLFRYGALSGDISNLELIGVVGSLSNNAALKEIYLVVSGSGRGPANLVWKGDNTLNQWDANSQNWLNNGAPDFFLPQDVAIFNDAGSNTPDVNLVGDLVPASVLVNATKPYTLAGSGKLIGTTGLTKTNNGTLTILTANDYTGVTVLGGGTLSVSNLADGLQSSPIGASTSDAEKLVFEGGKLRYTGVSRTVDRGATIGAGGGGIEVEDAATTLAFSGLLTGNGQGVFAKTGSGKLRLDNVANTLNSPISVDGGILAIGTAPATIGTGPVTLRNEAVLSMDNTSGSTFSFPGHQVTVPAGATGVVHSASLANAFTGQFLSGDANSVLIVSNLVSCNQTSPQFDGFAGTITIAAGSTFRISANSGINGGTNALFNLEGTLYNRSKTTVNLGGLTGPTGATLAGPQTDTGSGFATFVIGARGTDTVFQGAITDGNSSSRLTQIQKVGTGKLTLAGANTYTGPTTISQGVLALSDSGSIAASTNVTVDAVLDLSALADPSLYLYNAGQGLGGNGTIRGSAYLGFGTLLAPGSPVGALTVTNTLTMSGDTVMELNRTLAVKNDQLVANTFVISGATLTVTNLGPDLVTGDKFVLFSKPVAGFAAVNLPQADASGTISYVWSNKLDVDGSLEVLSGANPLPTTPTNLQFSVSGGNLTLSWPAEYTGWILQSQNSPLSMGLQTNTTSWLDVPGSETAHSAVITIDPAQPARFFRLRLP